MGGNRISPQDRQREMDEIRACVHLKTRIGGQRLLEPLSGKHSRGFAERGISRLTYIYPSFARGMYALHVPYSKYLIFRLPCLARNDRIKGPMSLEEPFDSDFRRGYCDE